MWVIENKDKVFFYQESGLQVERGLQGNNVLFIIGIQTEWQREMMLQCGHENGVSIDATFGTNQKKVCNYGGALNVNNLCVNFVIANHLK